MIVPQELSEDAQRALEALASTGVVAEDLEYVAQIIEVSRDFRMVKTKCGLIDPQRALEALASLGVVADDLE